MARIFAPIHPPNDPSLCEPWLNKELRRIGQQLRQASLGLAAVTRGESPDGSGQPLPTPNLTDYWFKPGVSNFGIAYGDVVAAGEVVISSTKHDTKGFIRLGSPIDVLTVDESFGYVGINKDVPDVALDVVGTANGGGAAMVPSSTISSTWAPTPTTYYTSLGGASTAGQHYTALSSDDGASSFVAIEAATPNGVNPEKVGLSGTITPGSTYTVRAKIFTLSGTMPGGSNFIFSLVDSAGDQWVAGTISITGTGTTPVEISATITCSGSPTSSGNTVNAVWLAANAGFSYVCVTYVTVEGLDQDITHWSASDDTLLDVINSTGQLGIGIGSDPIGAMLHIVPNAADTIGEIIRAFAAQTANLVQFQNSSSVALSGFTAAGKYYLVADAGTGKVLVSDVNGVGSWASAASLATRISHAWKVNGPFFVDTTWDGTYVPDSAFTITSVKLWRGTAGSGGTSTVLLKKNGSTIATIAVDAADGSNFTESQNVSLAVAIDDKLTIDVSTAETGVPLDLTLIIEGA